jgi:hypothetical protein
MARVSAQCLACARLSSVVGVVHLRPSRSPITSVAIEIRTLASADKLNQNVVPLGVLDAEIAVGCRVTTKRLCVTRAELMLGGATARENAGTTVIVAEELSALPSASALVSVKR